MAPHHDSRALVSAGPHVVTGGLCQCGSIQARCYAHAPCVVANKEEEKKAMRPEA